MSNEQSSGAQVGLTAAEISNIWAAYMKSCMEQRFFEYFIKTTENPDVKKIVENMLNHALSSLGELKEIFVKEKLSVPVGFTESDVNSEAPKAFSDTFILFFCQDITMLSMTTYPCAFSDCSRADIRDFFKKGLEFFMAVQNEVVGLMLSQGVYLRAPQVAVDNGVDFVDSKKYLIGLFGGSRPVNTSEIANLTRIMHRAQFSKMIFVSFAKLTTDKELSKHFSKGRDVVQSVLDSFLEVLQNENIPMSSSSDYKTFDVDAQPISDKLMLFFVNMCLGIFCFTMISQAKTSSFRSDIVMKASKIMKDMEFYYAEGLKLMIEREWLEQPPQAVDRRL